jgi:GTP cyclohydrolase II
MPAKQREASVYQDPGVAVTGLSRTRTSGTAREIGPQILKDLDLSRVRLFTNERTKVVGLRGFDLKITDRVSIEVEPNSYSERT